MQTDSAFFDYYCARCDAPFCERVLLMNLALDYTEDAYCLDCLALMQQTPSETLADTLKGYIASRECFKTPWDKFNATPCPRVSQATCFCQDDA